MSLRLHCVGGFFLFFLPSAESETAAVQDADRAARDPVATRSGHRCERRSLRLAGLRRAQIPAALHDHVLVELREACCRASVSPQRRMANECARLHRERSVPMQTVLRACAPQTRQPPSSTPQHKRTAPHASRPTCVQMRTRHVDQHHQAQEDGVVEAKVELVRHRDAEEPCKQRAHRSGTAAPASAARRQARRHAPDALTKGIET